MTKNDADHNLYYLKEDRKMLIIVLYVDDLIIIVNQPHWENSLIEKLATFSVWNDRTWTSQFVFLGVEFLSLHTIIFMCQCAYVTNILDEFQMTRCNPMPMPFWRMASLARTNDRRMLIWPYIVELTASSFTSPIVVLISPMWWGYFAYTWTSPKKHRWKGHP